jgi:hypothetical protein
MCGYLVRTMLIYFLQVPNCPVCRGPVQIHAGRIDHYLNSSHSSRRSHDGLAALTTRLRHRATEDGWSAVLTAENFWHGMGILAAGGIGFYQGYSPERTGLLFMDSNNIGSAAMQSAYIAAFAVGLALRVLSYFRSPRRDDD